MCVKHDCSDSFSSFQFFLVLLLVLKNGSSGVQPYCVSPPSATGTERAKGFCLESVSLKLQTHNPFIGRLIPF